MCGAKRFMLNKNLFRVFSFVIFFCFVLVSPICLASNQNGKTPNGYTSVNDFRASSDEEETNKRGNSLIEGSAQSNNVNEKEPGNGEEDLDVLFVEAELVQEEPNNYPNNLTENNNQSNSANGEEPDEESWHEEEDEKSDFGEEEEEEECGEGYNFNTEEESLEEDTPELEVNDGDYDADDEDDYYI